MTEIKLKYMVSIFCDTSDITPNASTYSKLATALGDSYLSLTIQEMTPNGQVNRIAMEKPELGIKILFLMNRIIIEKYPTDINDGDSIGSFENFCDLANDIIRLLLEQFEKNSNRLSFICKYLLKKEAQDDMNIYAPKLFQFPPASYNSTNTFEWTWKMARIEENTFDSHVEPMNYGTNISRIRGKLAHNGQEEEFEALDIEFDLNTMAENATLRFDKPSIISFYQHAKTWQASHYETIMSYIKD